MLSKQLPNPVFLKFILALFFLLTISAEGQENFKTFGDPAKKDEISAKTKAISGTEGESVFILTQRDVLGLNSLEGADIRGIYADGKYVRISAHALNEFGKYSVEFYLENETIIMAYESFEYYAERTPKTSWKNVRGLAAWERRSYFETAKIVYAETRGTTARKAGLGAPALSATLKRLLNLLKKQTGSSKAAV